MRILISMGLCMIGSQIIKNTVVINASNIYELSIGVILYYMAGYIIRR
ncbi:hypothetical protein [Terrisporobacter muris]|uniref:Uncharacterized protein n=1 Tax=Terrisporobacter muris TaxID=2963284 RepID=A0A9X2S2U6_9FIRM|nr:hypothetical protein [Terrisporobacter muris]MCR1821731.1 hypothetical protein [Terrisporobacter muris]